TRSRLRPVPGRRRSADRVRAGLRDGATRVQDISGPTTGTAPAPPRDGGGDGWRSWLAMGITSRAIDLAEPGGFAQDDPRGRLHFGSWNSAVPHRDRGGGESR